LNLVILLLMPESPDTRNLDLKASLKKPLQWALAAGLLTAQMTLFLPKYYRSEARLLPVETKGLGGNLGSHAGATDAVGASVASGGNYANFMPPLRAVVAQYERHSTGNIKK